MRNILFLLLLFSCANPVKQFDSETYNKRLSYLERRSVTLDEFDKDINGCEALLDFLGPDDKDYSNKFDELCDLKRRYNGTLRGYNEVLELVNERGQNTYKKRKAYDVGDCGFR